MIELYLAVGISLIITCLVVRDRTAYKISRLRAELMGLRNEERRAAELLTEVEVLISRISESILRADRRDMGLQKGCEQLGPILEELRDGVEDDEETQTQPPADDTAELKESL